MAVTLAALQLISSLYRQGYLLNRRSVIELGSQDLHPKQDHVAGLLERLVGFQRDPDRDITPEDLYTSLGFTTYRCIDADGRHNALKLDLNNSLAKDYGYSETFDVVTNHGTTEHVFDQCRVFQNIHTLCAPNGLMIHEVPFQKWVNHGFYNYQPSFFYDLAAANNYLLVGIYLGLPSVGDLIPYSSDLANTLSATSLPVELLVVLQKNTKDEFRIPYNGKYLETCSLKEQYQTQEERMTLFEQFFPGARQPRADTTTDINHMTAKKIAGALVRRGLMQLCGK